GQTLTQPGFMPFKRPDPFSMVADRLRDYNYEVLEKDLTGMSQMQQQMNQMNPPEPSDAEIKDALWVVSATPSQGQFGPGPSIAPKVIEHLANGGSALFVMWYRGEDMSGALKDWGIEAHTDMITVHEPVQTTGARGEMMDQAQRIPFIFEIRNWGDHLITKPLRALAGVLYQGVPIKTTAAKGVTTTPLIPIPDAPQAPRSWGETNVESIDQNKLQFDAGVDLPGPLYAAAAADKQGGGRVVVISGGPFLDNGIVGLIDPELLERSGVRALRFPGNSEFFTNSVFWLT